MKSFLIKVLWNGEEIVFRDLMAGSTSTLFNLHEAVQKAFGLSGDQMAGFTKIDEELQIEVDYQLESFDENTSLMTEVELKDVFTEEGDLIDYTYDFLNDILFSIEVMEVLDEETKEIKVVKRHGELPADLQKNANAEDAESILIQAMLGDDLEDDPDDIFEDEGFESLDDYEDLY